MDKVAVLLPIYAKDNPNWFQISLISVLNQDYCNVEIHIGVDGPINDDLESVLDQFNGCEKIIIHRYEKNRGLACVLNDLLIDVPQEIEYIARMDADDISLSNRFSEQIKFLKEHPLIDVVGCHISEIDEESHDTGKIIKYPITHEQCFMHFRYRDPLAHPSVMFRRSFFDKVKGYRPEFRKNQDTMLWFDGFSSNCLFSNVDKVLLKFRITNDFYSRRTGLRRAKDMLKNRITINRRLGYDLSASIFAVAMFLMTISPKWLKKFLYSIRP